MLDTFRVVGRFLRTLPPETAHRATISALARGLVPPASGFTEDRTLQIGLLGLAFDNPVGLAAGFDKNAEVADAMLAQGFGFVEVGTITRHPQAGNPRPRIFRLPRDQAMINRLGFNNEGLAAAAVRLAARREAGHRGIVGANIGPNKDTDDAVGDLAVVAATLAPLADYLVVNVSSPNTPGLRDWQRREPLARLIDGVQRGRARAPRTVPLLIKIAPDVTPADIEAIADVALANGIDGLIATNTTVDRPAALHDPAGREAGGLSGRPLMARSTAVLAALFSATGGRLPLIGVGGIACGADAYGKIRAGASLVQLYTALIYQGPRLVAEIRRELAQRLRADGFATLAEAVGSAGRPHPAASVRAKTAP
ncbi:MAG: quinone-dependent dihydroorotate dehydrogenase [Rhodospirillales bacterium]|nr:quinone-dependent dihydroorotate dehydrogenase [Rhodospirillales bacterium]